MPLYFDHNATTPVAPSVLSAWMEAAQVFGNASSIHHFGQAAKGLVDVARERVAARIGASGRDIVFTSGGTESDNLAIFGAVRASKRRFKHVVTTAIEHPAVLNTCAQLAAEGVAVTFLPVGSSGVVQPDDVRDAISEHTVLVSVMHANNETGAIQPIREIAAFTRRAGVVFHCDGVQAAGRLRADVRDLNVDLYSISGHKMNAPKGTGALYIRAGTALAPLHYGGHQERDRRGGTENVPGIAALAAACDQPEIQDCGRLRDRFEAAVCGRIPGIAIQSAGVPRLSNTSNVRFGDVSAEALVIALDLAGCAVSTGSACSSGSVEPSHVLLAMGLSELEARASVRFSFGLGNTEEQVDRLVDVLEEAVLRLRSRGLRKASHHA